jgi:hypothetical protein
MPNNSLTIEAKARLFDQLIANKGEVIDALIMAARANANALIISHKAGLRAGFRGLGRGYFGLDSLAAAYEILTGEPLNVDQLIHEARLQHETAPAEEALA